LEVEEVEGLIPNLDKQVVREEVPLALVALL
jgi:hypothetical protein